MGATFSSSGAEVQAPPAAAAAAAGCDDKKLWNDDLVDSYVFVVDTAEVDVSQAAAANGDDVKKLWPELVGRHVIDAAREIVEDRPEVRVYFYDYCKNAPPPGFDPKRVVLFRDSENLVVTVPKLG